jgi:DNA adenine methylase
MPKTTSIIRYPGGKSFAIPILKTFVPEGIKKLYSPFFGGGSFELFCMKEYGVHVFGNDIYEPVFDLFNQMSMNKTKLLQAIDSIKAPTDRKEFQSMKVLMEKTKSKLRRAAYFYILNKCSFNGLPTSFSPIMSKRSNRDLSLVDLSRLRMSNKDFKGFFEDIYPLDERALLFVDPPYYINASYYGYGRNHLDFDHQALAKYLTSTFRNAFWILCYNDCEEVRKMYQKNHIINVRWHHTMSKSKTQEIVILSISLSKYLGKKSSAANNKDIYDFL